MLHWLRKLLYDLNTFVANRVASIQTTTNVSAWAHVRSKDNPADLLSRGMEMSEFLSSELWFHGPKWLHLPPGQWPESKLSLSADELKNIDNECKPSGMVAAASELEQCGKSLIYQHSSWDKVMRITVYVLRFKENCRKSSAERPHSQMLSQCEILLAIEHWAKRVQGEHYAQEIRARKAGTPLPEKSKIAGLNPVLNSAGVLCVGGRLARSDRSDEHRHQIIIPPRSRMGWLLMHKAHSRTLHGGVQMMIRYVRSNFWIPRLRSEARLFVSKCTTCFRMAKQTETQLMGDLPAARVRPARAFYRSGVDFAGPYEMRMRPGRPSGRAQAVRTEKGYVAVFVCMVTRAVHLEPVTGMTAEAFRAAFSRFVARRGVCAHMYSDNGTTFVGADREMREAMEIWQKRETMDFVQAKGTEWHFITPAAPFQGGIWEAAVKSMKHHLRRVMGVQKYSYEALSTLLAEVEACLNSRPLCAMSDDKDDVRALTPAHFLIGEELVLPIPILRSDPPWSLNEMWRNIQRDAQDFWAQWSSEYLDSLQTRRKWKTERENVRVGQLALLKNENFAPTYWAVGRVQSVQTGADGLVRAVTILVNGKLYDRPIQKLCVLPLESELQYWH